MGDYDFKTTGFAFKGFREMYRAITHLPETVLKKELEPLLVRALKPMAALASALAPDDPITGPPWDLKSSIIASRRQRSGRAKKDRTLGKYDARAYMGPTKYGYPQAIFREFGRIHQPATPYMRPAWDSQKQVALLIITAGLEKRLHMIAQKYGPKG